MHNIAHMPVQSYRRTMYANEEHFTIRNHVYGVVRINQYRKFIWPLHYHDNIEIVPIPAGVKGWVQVGSVQCPVENGNFFTIWPGVIHAYDLHFEGRCTFPIIVVEQDYFADAMQHFAGCSTGLIRKRINELPVEHAGEAEKLFELMHRLSIVQNADTQDPFALAVEDMHILYTLFSTITREKHEPFVDLHETPLKSIIDAVQSRFSEPVSLGELAGMCGISKYRMCRQFKAYSGMTLWTYLNMVRIYHAQDLLRTKTRNVTEAAYACGFTNPSYFSRVFKQIAGQSPKKWTAAHT
ncbi:MAG: helix-turn-helix domain-containing protein [Chitinivibrionales bacterium]|nr:helix-turn-helix domain-containing protein [Chitinivibrionales bacterium]